MHKTNKRTVLRFLACIPHFRCRRRFFVVVVVMFCLLNAMFAFNVTRDRYMHFIIYGLSLEILNRHLTGVEEHSTP